MEQKNKKAKKEPVFIVKAATKHGGLDYLHIALIVLVVVLVGVAFSLSIFKKGVVLQNCPYGVVNSTCAAAPYTNGQVMDAVGKVLAGYSTVNSSLSLLSYYSLVNQSIVSYLSNQSGWLVEVPYIDPLLNNKTLYASFVLNPNLSLKTPFLSTISPLRHTNNSVVSFGVVSISGKNTCNYTKPIPVYLVVDPYVPGFISYMKGALNLSKSREGSASFKYYFVFSAYSASFYGKYGAPNTQALGRYLACASQQPRFSQFISNLSIAYQGSPLSESMLSQMVAGSGLNSSAFATCMQSVNSTLFNQNTLVGLYNITSVPSYVVNCKYQTIPETANSAIGYALKQISK